MFKFYHSFANKVSDYILEKSKHLYEIVMTDIVKIVFSFSGFRTL